MALQREHPQIASMDDAQYDAYIEEMRQVEYPMLRGKIWLVEAWCISLTWSRCRLS